MDLFNNNGAEFSECRKYRYALWRKWDSSKSLVMFIGLNPSTANEDANDPTIRRVISIANNLGFGGVYMMNCFPYVSTNPNDLKDCSNIPLNDVWLERVSKACEEIVFAWGDFKIVRDKKRDKELAAMFPYAKALQINKNGSPKHPLYVRNNVVPVKFFIRP